MAVRPVLTLPEAALTRPALPIRAIDDATRRLAADLVDTMRAHSHCVGLAAPQIGVPLRAFAMDVTGHRKARSCHGEVVLLNPRVLLVHGSEVAREGCMSVPDLTGDVSRATTVVVGGVTLDGGERVLRCDAFEARAVLHEMDHLDGVLFLDRVTAHDRVFRRRVYR